MTKSKCPYCHKEVATTNKDGLRDHIMVEHPTEWTKMQEKTAEGNQKALGWRCLQCDKVFHETAPYRQHFRSKHE